MIDPTRFQRLLVQLLTLLAIFEVVGALMQGAGGGGWDRLGGDLIIAGILYLTWDRIVRGLEEQKRADRKRVEQATENLRLREAFVFSLLASDEIYQGVPEDRRRVVVIAYTLISFGLVAAFVKIGSGLMPLVVSGALVLSGVNLLAWIVSVERTQRETLKTELKLARDVQMTLMPRQQPAIPGYDIAGMSNPALDVGGDLYDYIPLKSVEDRLGIAVLDVSGKGLKAAMSTVFASGAYTSEARLSSSPAEILTNLNKAVWRHSPRGHFIAFLLAALDPATAMLTFANAGQTRPLLRSCAGVQTLNGVGVHFPLGMQEDTVFEERSIELAPGDICLLMTDGFTDAMNVLNEQYGTERVEKFLASPGLAAMSATEIVNTLIEEVKDFAGVAAQTDDMTVVVIKRNATH
jgi:serine phosphatase RsbU (regulator of sigma subunit)